MGKPLVSLRTAVILTLGTLAGTGAGILTYLGSRSAANTILAGEAAFAGAVFSFNTVIN
ncbi:hypothetical protein [Kitasatospora sp. GP82]|uniref:hypothetical protein n=1 Tax=Kitasatospora sp. GP82 TaxID=3035089 RepID=UPI0024750095|nr:hypothetical protein [Kitasatospora sp. GP82]MDH6129303.1 hypothetical protein [Kitasatospora sp. GP82]